MHKKLLENSEENHVLVYPSCLNEGLSKNFPGKHQQLGWILSDGIWGPDIGTFNSWSKGSCAKISLSWSDPSAIVPAEVRMFWVFPRGVCTEVVFETQIFGTNTVDDEKSCTTCVVYPTICDWFSYLNSIKSWSLWFLKIWIWTITSRIQSLALSNMIL